VFGKMMDAAPELVEIYGSTARHLLGSLLESYKHSPPAREAVRRKVERVQADLAGPDPTPLERLLAERAALCWLQVYRYEASYEQARDLSLRQADFHQRRIDAAHKRFLSAVRTLAQIRKLALPAVQINLAKNQVNVASS
jgi:hypothetical protein